MAADRHKLWRMIRTNYLQLEQKAPEGYIVAAEVFLAEREQPIEVVYGQTGRGADDPWVWFQCRGPEAAGNGSSGDYFVMAHESTVLRVELRLRRGTRRAPIGLGQRSGEERSPISIEQWA
jgi:hypothetical protein